MRTVSVSIVAGLVLLLALAVPAMAGPITGPTEITAPGTYTLNADVINSGSTAYIVVKANNVVIDGNNHLLDGVDYSTAKGIVVERYIKNNVWYTPTNVEIKNIVLRDWGIGISAYLGEIAVDNAEFRSSKQGILFKTVHQGSVSNSIFNNNVLGAEGLIASNLKFDNCKFSNNNGGLLLEQSSNIAVTGGTFNSNYYGVYAEKDCSNVNVADAKFTKQSFTGIRYIDTVGGTISGNTFNGNLWGIDLMGTTTAIKITQNVLANNQQEALYIGPGVAGNRIWDNKFNNWHNVRFAGAGANAWISATSEANAQPEYGAGPNIIGKMVIGGNFWAQPDMMGWSQITYDVADVYGNVGPDDIADWPFEMTPTNVDDFPLHQ